MHKTVISSDVALLVLCVDTCLESARQIIIFSFFYLQRRNLGSIAKILQYAASNKMVRIDICCVQVLKCYFTRTRHQKLKERSFALWFKNGNDSQSSHSLWTCINYGTLCINDIFLSLIIKLLSERFIVVTCLVHQDLVVPTNL